MFEISVFNRHLGDGVYQVFVKVEAPGAGDEVEQRISRITQNRAEKRLPVAVLKNSVLQAQGPRDEFVIYRITGTATERNQEGTIKIEIDPALATVRAIKNTARATASLLSGILNGPTSPVKWRVI